MVALFARRVHTVQVHLGETDLDELRGAIAGHLRRRHARVIVNVVEFGYFDEQTLAALTEISADNRVNVVGLEAFAEKLLGSAPDPVVDVRSAAERAVTHLQSVTVVNGCWQAKPLDDPTWTEALQLAMTGGRQMITLDLRHAQALSPHQLLTLAELSADMNRELRTLVIVNVHPHVDEQLRTAGLHGDLLIGMEEKGGDATRGEADLA